MAELIISLDITEEEKMDEVIEKTENYINWYKVGPVPFLKFGFNLIEKLKKLNKKIFFDFKFFDIPNTVKGSVENCCKLGIDMLSLHILGGERMVKEAIEIRNKVNKNTKIVGITVLTSFSGEEFGFPDIKKMVSALAESGFKWELDGIVCSGQELSFLRKYPFYLIVPGIRIEKVKDDQKRVITPSDAVKMGADFLVVGRPIYESKNPENIVKNLTKEMKNGKMD